MLKKSLDDLVISNLKVTSKKEAVSFIIRGMVLVNGVPQTKPKWKVPVSSILTLKPPSKKFVSRGGEKLEYALKIFSINVKDYICIDIGSSTGGFTHCLLSNGSKLIYALDCGKNLLDPVIKKNSKVISIEGVNAKYLSQIPHLPSNINLVTIDVSFISIKKILPQVLKTFKSKYKIACLFKPYFESPTQYIKKGGVLPQKFHLTILTEFLQFLTEIKISVSNFCVSPLLGEKSKNQEYFFLLTPPTILT